MSKRFTETGKYDDPWYCDLSKDAKLAWEYVLAKCDACGVWEPNFKMATACLGKIDWKSVLSEFGSRVQVLKNGRWFVVKFVAFQYGKLSESCKPHLNVLRLLRQHGISLYPLDTLSKEYPKAIHSLQDKEEDKDKDKEKEKDSGSSGDEESREEEPIAPVMINNGEALRPKTEPTTEHTIFIKLWTDSFLAVHGEKYAFSGAKDGSAVKALIARTGLSAVQLMEIVNRAWKQPTGFNCKQAVTIYGLNSRFNEIRAELRAPASYRGTQTAADLKAANAHREHGLRPEDRPKVYNPMTDPDEF